MEILKGILQLPERCIINKKITKAFFKRNFDLTTGEKSVLEDFNLVNVINWMASLNPANANINRFQDDHFLYEEVQVITVQTAEENFDKNHFKISDLIQKYIPYPILLCVYNSDYFVLNTCVKKINQNDNTRRIIDKSFSTESIYFNDPSQQQQDFLKSIGFSELDKTHLKSYYDSYTLRMIALQAVKVSGLFIPRTLERSKSDMENLERIEILQKEIEALKNLAQKETQLNQRIVINTTIQMHKKQINALNEMIAK